MNRKRKVWSRSETLLLLNCYDGRKEEFTHVRKKKYAYAHVLEDMVFQGFQDTSVTEVAIANKMRTLLSAYKCANDTGRKTGASATIIPYMDVMDDIFGKNPIISNSHTLDLGHDQALQNISRDADLDLLLTESIVYEPLPATEIEADSTPSIPTETLSPPSTSSKCAPPAKRKKTAKDKYYEELIEIKKSTEKRKERKIKEVSEGQKEFLTLKARQLDLDERKINLL